MARENFVNTAATNHLRGLYSFVRGDTMDRKLASKLALAPDETIAGVYINHSEDYLVFTEFCIRHFYGQKQQIIQYRSISKVELPDEDVPELILTLEDGQVVSLLIENETEGHADIFEVHDFLTEICAAHSITTLDVRNVDSRDTMIEYLRTPAEWSEFYTLLADWLDDGQPPLASLTKFGIDPSLMLRPDVWRLLALLLTGPVRNWHPDED